MLTQNEKKVIQGNRRDMRKIHVTRQFFEASGRHGDLIEKTKNPFLDKVNGTMCAKFQLCIVFRWARRRDTHTQINTYTIENRNIIDRHVNFDNNILCFKLLLAAQKSTV